MGEFVRVASASEIPSGEMMVVDVGDQEVVVANVGGEFVAFGNECTHRGGPLGEGLLEGDTVECPFHAARFNAKTGEATGAPAESPIPTFKVQVDGDDVKVSVD
jgi:nitrite reductase/ring-hydroxylating ferredoxin subunit